jgi:hypothetical protein
MIGDLGYRGLAVTRSSSVSYGGSINSSRSLSPIVGGGAFKIAENESPRPQDRFFITGNYYSAINTFNSGGSQFNVLREVIGFERTFMDGDASVGMRLPFLQRTGGDGSNTVDGVGDLSIILKYAFVNDRHTGNVLSGGMVVTAPTGRDIVLATGTNIHNVLLQPWVGGILNADRFYFHGFSSVVLPVDSQDIAFWSNDFGLGFKLYQREDNSGGGLRAIIPTLEAHLLTPLNHNGVSGVLNGTSLLGLSDQLILTAGVHLGVGERAWLTIGMATPVTGPRQFEWEGVVQLNYAF